MPCDLHGVEPGGRGARRPAGRAWRPGRSRRGWATGVRRSAALRTADATRTRRGNRMPVPDGPAAQGAGYERSTRSLGSSQSADGSTVAGRSDFKRLRVGPVAPKHCDRFGLFFGSDIQSQDGGSWPRRSPGSILAESRPDSHGPGTGYLITCGDKIVTHELTSS
jgi:hypothetical protein